MHGDRKHIFMIAFLAAAFSLAPFVGYGAVNTVLKEQAAAASTSGVDFFNPQIWFKILRQNIAVPTFFEEELGSPSPTAVTAVQSMFGPQIKELNEKIKNRTGIDFIKFFSWISGVITSLFHYITALLSNININILPQK